ncbi:hypothetical protein VTI74DRAFT_9540 [Chaetomium olivicolor]
MAFHKFEPDAVARLRGLIVRTRAGEATAREELQGEVWATAVRVRGEIVRKLELGPRDNLMGLLWTVDDWKAWKASKIKEVRQGSWGVSSLGIVDGQPAGGGDDGGNGERTWKITRAVFSGTALVVGAPLAISAIAVKGGEMVQVLTWQVGALSEEVAGGVAEDLQSWLTDLGEGRDLDVTRAE